MKRILIIVLAIVVQNLFSQDTIVKRNNEWVVAKILEINPTEVKFKKWNNLDGPLYSESIAEIVRIKYANGSVDTFNIATRLNSVAESLIVKNTEAGTKPNIYSNISNHALLDLIEKCPDSNDKLLLKSEYIKMLDYRNTQYLATGFGYGIGFAVPVVFTYAALTSSVFVNDAFITIVTGAILGAAIRTTGAVIAKINKNKRLHKKEEIISIYNNLK